MSNLWQHEPIEDDSAKKLWYIKRCLYCNQHLETADGWVDGRGESSHERLGDCLSCGWWFYNYGFLAGRRGNDCFSCYRGLLKSLDLTDVSLPISDVKAYLRLQYERRFELHPKLFEDTVASVFKDLGYKTEVTAYSKDGGIDVVLRKKRGEPIVIQVKRYRNKIEVEQLRSLVGAMVIGGHTEGMFVTTSEFTAGVKDEANLAAKRGIGIELYDASRFFEVLKISHGKVNGRPRGWKPWWQVGEGHPPSNR